MTRRVSVAEARANFSELLGSVYHTGEPVIVERRGKPVAVLVSPEQFGQGAATNGKTSEAPISHEPPPLSDEQRAEARAAADEIFAKYRTGEEATGWKPQWVSEEELARRQEVYERTMELRARTPSIAPLTSVDLIRIAREEELESYGLGE